MNVAAHQSTITIDGAPPITLPVIAQTITMDEEWTPYIKASVRCPLTPESAALNPLQDTWATITVNRLLGRVERLSDITRRYRGATLAAVTSTYAGKTIADVTRSVYHDYTDPTQARRGQTRTFRLMLRDTAVNERDATIDLSLASAEARLFDDANVGPEFAVPGDTILDVMNWVTARSGLLFSQWQGILAVSPASTLGEARIWQPGQSAFDFLKQVTLPSLALVWADETGALKALISRGNGAERIVHSAGDDRSVVNAVDRVSRDDDWYTAVIVIWNRNGTTTRGYATTPGAPDKVYTRTYPENFGPPSDPNQHAEAIRRLLVTRGRALELLAVSDYALTPRDRITYDNPRRDLKGRASAVQWTWPDDEMSIRMREVEPA